MLKKKSKLNAMELEQELEHEQLVKGVNKCELGKKILLVECLIGTEKRREIYIISEYMILGK